MCQWIENVKRVIFANVGKFFLSKRTFYEEINMARQRCWGGRVWNAPSILFNLMGLFDK